MRHSHMWDLCFPTGSLILESRAVRPSLLSQSCYTVATLHSGLVILGKKRATPHHAVEVEGVSKTRRRP